MILDNLMNLTNTCILLLIIFKYKYKSTFLYMNGNNICTINSR